MSTDVLQQLEGLARRLRNNPAFMSDVLAIYQKQERLSDAELVRKLNATPAMLVRLALCKRPDPNSLQFGDQVRQIAAYTNTDAGQLAMILRQVEVLETLSTLSTAMDAQETHPQQVSLRSGLLAAARDRKESESDQPASAEDKP